MSFKFTLLGLEITKDKTPIQNNNMKNKKRSKKQTTQQKKFGRAVKSCHKTTKTPKSFGSCMRKKLR